MANWNGAVATREEIRELKRRAAVRVAARIFNEKGYHATSLDEIADEIGVTKTALYYYFRNKEQLLYECLKMTYDSGQEARLAAEKLNGSAFEKLQYFYRSFMEQLIEERGAYTTTANIRALPEDHQAEVMDRRRQLEAYTRMLLETAIADGAVRPLNVTATSSYFLGSINWLLRWRVEEEEMSARDTAETFLDLFINGIALPAG
ncbi:TetR/AcrR family transcriptional regulator [Pseudooceanicola aestuarii]|uniref:TetR/AcrR family transcriptional regulator n=1 Tax=Pseudooceanicola aestuarii TaxID=2697319 RepID=UPI0013CF80AD|nr:TetR/AcrR family transcriptional regulator [Pseudooceanicola aestuarii]